MDSYLEMTILLAFQKLATDASGHATGWYFEGKLFSESVDPSKHINVKEFLALNRALKAVGPRLHLCPLVWEVDNTVAQYATIKQGSYVFEELCRHIDVLLLAESIQVVLVPARLSSTDNLLADSTPCSTAMDNWSLNDKVARMIFARVGHQHRPHGFSRVNKDT